MKIASETVELSHKILGQGLPIIVLHGWSFDHRHMESALEPAFAHY